MSEIKVEVWKNKPEFMNRTEGKLTAEEILEAVKHLTQQGLEMCAAGYLLCMTGLKIEPNRIGELMEVAI